MSNSDLQFHVVQDHHHDHDARNQIHDDHDHDHPFEISSQLLKFPDYVYDDDHDLTPATPSDQDDHHEAVLLDHHHRNYKDDDEDDQYQQETIKEEEECETSSSGTGRALILVLDPDDQEEQRPSCRRTSVQAPLGDQLLLSDHFKVNDQDELDDEGFKTPTSLDHKIPKMKQCPPAPKKPKAAKRKLLSSTRTISQPGGRTLQLDFCQHLQSMFPPIVSSSSSSSLNNIPDLHRKIKKARRQEEPADDHA